MNRLVVIIATILVPTGYSAAEVLWCYHDPSCNDTTWPTIATEHCNGSHQSPINIISASAVRDANLTEFNFTKYGDNSTMKNIKNTGETVKVELRSGVQITGGALSEAYDSLQFHLHWGNGTSVPGSEHTVDGTRYPMELHIVNAKSSHNGNTTTAVTDSTGLAALGFFIEAMPGNATGSPAAWNTLTSYLANITLKDDIVNITHAISLDELLEGVDRTKYYRYLGSLTTPNCNEAVVWTVFKDPIKVSQDLIDLFSTTLHIGHNSTSALMTNVFRNIQPVNGRMVKTQSSPTTAPPVSGASTMCSSLALMALAWMLLRV
ncbi:carbonic anhydrase 4-like [Salvelinus sp. IW2-2015]|uniref:carbonic anhydrase 4-like n=1 Tax=Salvelinus sp. IW2-2015 TaxID=2691554 RepID=UPI000CDFD91C|nr:carbonic anhydrase 4-like [Salvelinus alpinus]